MKEVEVVVFGTEGNKFKRKHRVFVEGTRLEAFSKATEWVKKNATSIGVWSIKFNFWDLESVRGDGKKDLDSQKDL